MLAQIDKICTSVGVWPHAFLSGHAHNYQRFTRTRSEDSTQIPYIDLRQRRAQHTPPSTRRNAPSDATDHPSGEK